MNVKRRPGLRRNDDLGEGEDAVAVGTLNPHGDPFARKWLEPRAVSAATEDMGVKVA
jgi:hypothetical protein